MVKNDMEEPVVPAGLSARAGPRLGLVALDVVLVGAVMLGVARVWSVLTGIPPLLWTVDDAHVPASALPQVLSLDLASAGSPVDAPVTILPLWIRVLGSLSIVLSVLILMRLLRTVKHASREVSRGDIDFQLLASRLRHAGRWVFGLALARFLIDALTIASLTQWTHTPQADSIAVGTSLPSLSLGYLIAGVAALVVAKAFDEAARAKRELDGLI